MNRKLLAKKSINLSLIATFVVLFSMFCATVTVSAADVPYDIGAFYFSNWNPELSPHMVVNTKNTYGRDNDWFGGIKDTLLKPGPWGYGPIADREPMLGWYDDRQQSVLDNQILQASSRGISHFAFYYYWKEDGTKPRPGQNVELWKTSPNKDLMDYYLYFVADGAYNSTDWRAKIVPKLIEFMKEPQYKRSKSTDPSMNDRPIIGFFGDMLTRLGGTDASLKVELDYLRAESVKAGVGDPILLCNGYRALSNFMVQGYDGFQPLNLAGLGMDENIGVPEDYASSFPAAWKDFVTKDYTGDGTGYENYENYMFIPGGLNAFDARPWKGVASDNAGNYYYADPSPNKFKVQLNNVKDYLDTHPNSMNMATFYAWNEWGEGGSIEPNTLFGYGYVDAMQEVFNLKNTDYKIAANGVNDIAPDVRVDVEPEYSEVAQGQNVVLKVRVKNYSQVSVNGSLSLSQPAKNAEAIDQASWSVKSSSGTAFTLAAGAAGEAEFVITVGEGEDFNRHNFIVTADYGETQNISTFVVKVPPFYGCLEKDNVKKYNDYKFDLNVKVRNYTMDAKDVNYTLDLPTGWTADKLTGTASTAGYSGTGVHTNRTITDSVVISYPSTTVPGTYTINLTTGDGAITKVNSLTVNIAEANNLLYNGSFEIDENTDGMPDVWSGSGDANITVQTGTQLEPAPMGNKFVKVVGTGSDVGIKQEGTKGDVNWLQIDPKKKYQVSFWAKVESGKFSVIDSEAQGDYTWIGINSSKEITAEENGNVWKPYTLEFTPDKNAGRESLRFFVTADSGVTTTFDLDAVMLREIVPVKPAWYQNFETGSGFTAGTDATVAIDNSSASIGGLESVKLTTTASGDPGSSAKCLNVVPKDGTSFDASSYNYLNFYVKDTQGANTVKLTFVDKNNAECSVWADGLSSVKDQWTKINFPLSSITGIDKTAIKEIRVGEWNPGVYYFDDFYFSGDSTSVIPTLLKPIWYQNFETGSGFTTGTNAIVAIDSSSANNGGLESVMLTTSVSGDPGSSAQCVNVVQKDGTSFDASSYSYLNFYVKDTQGSNTVKLTFVDTNNAEYSIWTDGLRSVQNKWTQINFPLNSITGINTATIKEIRVGEWNPGVYYFDDFYFSADSTFVIPELGVNKTTLLAAITTATTNSTTATVSLDGSDVLPANKWVLQADLTTYTAAITTAQTVVNNENATEEEITNAVSTLTTATEIFSSAEKVGTKIIVVIVDKTALLAGMRNATILIESKTVGTAVGNVPQVAKDTFQSAITAATAVNVNIEITQAEVDAQVTAIATATTNFNNAVIVAPVVNRAALTKAISDATTLIESKTVGVLNGNVPQGAKDAFQSVIAAAGVVNENEAATQLEVDAQIATLATATTNFSNAVIVTTGVNKTALTKAISNATTLIKSKTVEKVPKKAKDTFQKAINTAKAVSKDKKATQAEVDAQVSALATATINFDNAVKVASDRDFQRKIKIIKERLDRLVKAGTITQTQEDTILKFIISNLDKCVMKNGLDGFVKEGTITKAQKNVIDKLVIHSKD